MQEKQRIAIEIKGIVQGVGFRPFIYGLAKRFALSGWVYNSSGGVFIEIEGRRDDCAAFLRTIKDETPVLARIDEIKTRVIEPQEEQDFIIKESRSGDRETLISPDMGICPDCLADIKDTANRRYRYPFTNCTNCGTSFFNYQRYTL